MGGSRRVDPSSRVNPAPRSGDGPAEVEVKRDLSRSRGLDREAAGVYQRVLAKPDARSAFARALVPWRDVWMRLAYHGAALIRSSNPAGGSA
jgi:hypothetical protein